MPLISYNVSEEVNSIEEKITFRQVNLDLLLFPPWWNLKSENSNFSFHHYCSIGNRISCIRVRINFIEQEEEMYTCVDKENKPWKNRELSFCPISINDEAPKKNEREREKNPCRIWHLAKFFASANMEERAQSDAPILHASAFSLLLLVFRGISFSPHGSPLRRPNF